MSQILKYYHSIDLIGNQLLNSRLHNVETASRIYIGTQLDGSNRGFQVYDTDLKRPFYWNGSSWSEAIISWGSVTGSILNQTDLINYLSANYYPYSTNPLGYITNAALAPYLTSSIASSTYVPLTRTITINGITQNLSANRTWTIDALPPQIGNGGKYLKTNGSVASWNNLSGNISLFTNDVGYLTPSSAASIYVPLTRNLTINGVTYNLSADRSWNISSLPSQTGNNGKYLQTDGTIATWQTVDALPTQTGNSGKFLTTNGTIASWSSLPPSGVTSVGLSMPSAFTVTNTPVTSSGTLTVTGAGTASQYIRGDGQLATLPSSPSGGGASISYYLNGSIPSSVATYEQLSRNPVFGPGTNYSTSIDGLIAQFLTDAGDPSLLSIPAGAWLIDLYFNASSAGGTPNFYVELYKYDGAIFTIIASNSTTPEFITNGTSVDLYTTSLAVPTTTLAITDRLAIRVYVACDTRTITLHTENGNLSQVITTFSTGISALNGLIAQVQFLSTGTSGTDFNINSATNTHTFNLPVASGTNTGKLSSTDWTTFNGKQDVISLTTTGSSGSSTFISNTLNVPTYTLAGLGGQPQLNGTGFVKATGTTITYDNSTYVTSNIYTANGTLTGTRTVTLNGFSLGFIGTSAANTTEIGPNGSIGIGNSFNFNNYKLYTAGNIFCRSATNAASSIALGVENASTGPLIYAYGDGSVYLGTDTRRHPNSNFSIGSATDIASAQLQVTSTTKGFLPPRMTTINRNAIAAPAQGLILYNTTSDRLTYRDVDSWEEVATTADIAPISAAANLFNYYNFY
jgi:hypothetical protein